MARQISVLGRAIEDMATVIDCTGSEIEVAFGSADALDHVAYDPEVGMFVWTGDRQRDVLILNQPINAKQQPNISAIRFGLA